MSLIVSRRWFYFCQIWISTNTYPGNKIQEVKTIDNATVALKSSETNAYYKKKQFLVW